MTHQSGARGTSAERRVALVTGAGTRVGMAIARAIGQQGLDVAIHYHASDDGARSLAEELRGLGVQAWPVQSDLSAPGEPEQLVERAVGHFGRLDVLVNSAAIMLRTPVGEVSADEWDRMFALNLRAPFFLAQAAARHLRAREGVIVNIADLAAFETWPAYIPHSITKAGIVQMTRSLAHALAPQVRVNAVAPGVVLLPEGWSEEDAEHLRRTTPLAKLGSPEDVASAVCYLMDARFITGETLIVDGGRHIRR